MSLADELVRLAELHRDGGLSDAEYAAAKARLLEPVRAVSEASASSGGVARRVDVADGRLVLAAGSTLIIASLFLPWLDFVLIRVSGFDVIRLAFGIDRAARSLGDLFAQTSGGSSGLRIAAAVLAVLVLTTTTGWLWRSPRIRARQTFVGATLLLGLAVYAMLRAGEGPLEVLGVGAWTFLLATLTLQVVAAVLMVRGSLGLDPSDERILPVRIVTSPNGRRAGALVVGPLLLVGALHWFLHPSGSSGPIIVEYDLAAFGSDGWEPQRTASIEVDGSGTSRTVRLPAPPPGPSEAVTTRLAAGRWSSGEKVTIAYVPSLSSGTARIAGLVLPNQFDEGARLSLDIPSQPSWRARFGEQELIVRVTVRPSRTTLIVDHGDFGELDRRSLRRVNEPKALEELRIELERQARIDREVRASCRALQARWRATFADFNRSEESVYGREWGFQGVTRSYREWARRARSIRNGLVAPYNATSARTADTRASAVPGGEGDISAINNRARSAIAAQRSAIDRYIDHWDSVARAAQLESDTLWRSRVDEIERLRTRARAGSGIDFGC